MVLYFGKVFRVMVEYDYKVRIIFGRVEIAGLDFYGGGNPEGKFVIAKEGCSIGIARVVIDKFHSFEKGFAPFHGAKV